MAFFSSSCSSRSSAYSRLSLVSCASSCRTPALTLTRRALQRSAVLTLEQQLEFEWTNQRTRLASPEFQEALSAFREKREPNFS